MSKKGKTRYPGVSKAPDGRFRVRAKVKDPRTGRTVEIDRILSVGSARDAADERARLRQEVLDGGLVRPDRTSLGDFAESWLKSKKGEVRQSTAERYAEALDLHIAPELGAIYLDALRPEDIREWRDRKAGAGYAPATVNGWLRVVKTLLADAAAELRIPNSAVRVRPLREPARLDEDPNVLTESELGDFLDAVREHAPSWYPLILVLATTGARFGEVTALRWTDIDEAAGVIRVRRAHRRQTVDETKTGKARTLPLTPVVAAALKAHRRDLVARQALGLAEGWVFPSAKGTLLFTSSIRKPILRCLAAAGIEKHFTVHGFRRTLNNILRKEVSMVVVRSITGHTTERMTEHYSHVDVDEKRAAVGGVVERLLGAPSGEVGGEPQS